MLLVMFMKYENIKYIFKVLLLIFIFVLGIKFFIFMLPFILIALLIYMVYKRVNVNNHNSANRTTSNNISKKGKVIGEAKVIKEKIVKE